MSYTPPATVAKAAQEGLGLRERYGRGGTRVGLARAHQLANRRPVSENTINRMVSFFSRHEKNKDTPPERGNGMIAWLLWGGDPGRTWAEKVQKSFKENPMDDWKISVKELESMLMRLSPREIIEVIDEYGAWNFLPSGGLSGASHTEMAEALLAAGYDPDDGLSVDEEYADNPGMALHDVTDKYILIDVNGKEITSLMMGASAGKRYLDPPWHRDVARFEAEMRELMIDTLGSKHARVRLALSHHEAQDIADGILQSSHDLDEEYQDDLAQFVAIVEQEIGLKST